LLITPGPAVLYVVTRSIDQGRGAGFTSALGVFVGTLCHVAAAALGLSALLMSSALAFQSVKYWGAGYLVYLGVRKFMGGEEGKSGFGVCRSGETNRGLSTRGDCECLQSQNGPLLSCISAAIRRHPSTDWNANASSGHDLRLLGLCYRQLVVAPARYRGRPS
jgi:LysE type translocator